MPVNSLEEIPSSALGLGVIQEIKDLGVKLDGLLTDRHPSWSESTKVGDLSLCFFD